MIYDLQKASVTKRVSAFLLDFIVLLIIATLFAYLTSVIVGYDKYVNDYDTYQKVYEQEYGVSFDITEEEYNDFDAESKDSYDKARKAFLADKDVLSCYNNMVLIAISVISLSVLLSYFIVDFVAPLVFKNGQTLGKKIFGIAVMRTEGIKVQPISLFIRTIFGKFAIETMIPLYTLIMLMFQQASSTNILLVLGICVVEIIVFFASKTNSLIHDVLSDTVAVDLSTQMIFDSKEDLLAYKEKIHAQEVKNEEY